MASCRLSVRESAGTVGAMSLQHVYRAEKLGRAEREDPKALEAIRSGGDLSEVRSEAGCNMLLVYLISRWGRLFSPGAPNVIAATEALQDAVVDAYVAAGCAVDDAVAPRQFAKHAGADFTRFFRLPSQKLSALGFVEALLAQIDAAMFPEPHAQLVRLEARLRTLSEGGVAALRPLGPEHATASLVRGVKVSARLGSSELRDLRDAAEALKLSVLVGGDVGSLPNDAEVDVAVGVELARASAEDGGPLPLSAGGADPLSETQRRYLASLGDVETLLVAFGPLASAYVVKGELGREDEGKPGRFVCGADESNTPHAIGVYGEALGAADAGVRGCDLPADTAAVFLIARYD
jgi:hypothetical protein